MLVPQDTDLVALANATAGSLVVIGGDPTCRMPVTCNRQQGGTPYQLPLATPVPITCAYISDPPTPPPKLYAVLNDPTLFTGCQLFGPNSISWLPFTIPSYLTLAQDPTNGCTYTATAPITLQGILYLDNACTTDPGPLSPLVYTLSLRFDPGTFALSSTFPNNFTDREWTPFLVNAVPGTTWDLHTPVTLTNSTPAAPYYGLWCPSIIVATTPPPW